MPQAKTAEPQDPGQFIYIAHDGVEAIGGPVTRQSYDEVWSALGWIICPPEVVAEEAEFAKLASLTGQSVADVRAQRAKK